MSADVFRRCGCRDEDGKLYTVAKPKKGEPDRRCPRMKDSRHGTWCYRASAGTVADPKPGAPGHRKRRYLTGSGFSTAKDAQEALAKAAKAYQRQGDKAFDKTTVDDYLVGTWIPRCRDELKPATAHMYSSYIGKHILGPLGAKRLSKLTKADVAAFVDHLRTKTVRAQNGQERTLGDVTIRRIYATLRSALSDAVEDGLIEANPALGVRLPAENRQKVKVWEQADAVRFIDAVRGHRLGPLFEFAISTGLRRGEICGLRWEDVELLEGRITVRVNLVEVNGRPMEGKPKTKAGEDRVLNLSQDVVELLMQVQERTGRERTQWGEHYQDSGRVFVHEDGTELRPSYPSKVMAKTVERLGLPPAHFHSLRHMFASIQVDLGVELTMLSKLMGHSTSAITSDVYSHMFAARERQQMNATSAWLRGAAPVAVP